jgi:hypothetical protein
MNETKQSSLNSLGWDTLKFSIENNIIEIPNNSILSKLIYVPILDKPFIVRILYQYYLLPETAIKINAVLARENDDIFLEEVMKVICEDKNLDKTRVKNYEQLYVILSLLSYQIPRQSQLINYGEKENASELILQEFSNLAVKNIRWDLRHPLPSESITKGFCKRNSFDYKTFKYNESISKYFWNILPQPLSLIPTYNRDSAWNMYTRNTFKQKMIDPDNISLAPSNKDLVKYDNRRNDLDRRMCAFYPEYYDAKKYLASLAFAREEECPNFFANWSNENDKNTSRNLSQQRSLKKENMKERILCKCQFCSRYRAEARTNTGKYARHCKDKDSVCETVYYRKFLNDLQNKGIDLEKLYE